MAPSYIPYGWNEGAGRFTNPGGQFVSISEVRGALDFALDEASIEARALAGALAEGSIGIAEFENAMRLLIKDTQIYSSAVAVGGFDGLVDNALAFVETRLESQFAYLSDWADDLAANGLGTAGSMGARARMYMQSARATYGDLYAESAADRGEEEERNIINPGEHCDDCLEMEALEWVPIGTLIPIGSRQCLGNCNCVLEYR